jgi:hypothetical protein
LSEQSQTSWLLFKEDDSLFILHPELGPCRLAGPFRSLLGGEINFETRVVSDEDETLVLTGENVSEATEDLLNLGYSKKKIRKLALRQENIAVLNRRKN